MTSTEGSTNEVPASGWLGLISSSATAVVVGFASTILLIMEAARAVGANPMEQGSWAAALCYAMALTTLILSWRYKMPIITAWSTPGAAVIATSGAGIGYANALGAFVVAGLLVCLAALLTPIARLIERIPAPVAAAMLAGVLVRYCLGVPGAALAMPGHRDRPRHRVLRLTIELSAVRGSGSRWAWHHRGDHHRPVRIGVLQLRHNAACLDDAAIRCERDTGIGRSLVPRHHGLAKSSGFRGAARRRLHAARDGSVLGHRRRLGSRRTVRIACDQSRRNYCLDRDRARLPSRPKAPLARRLALSRLVRHRGPLGRLA